VSWRVDAEGNVYERDDDPAIWEREDQDEDDGR
jgi:hypothetical protein